MDDAARLVPQTGAALRAEALSKDFEAPLKRDMTIWRNQYYAADNL